jgi:hypothetical protein
MRKKGLKNGTRIEIAFKAAKLEDLDEENIEVEDNFVRRMKKGLG